MPFHIVRIAMRDVAFAAAVLSLCVIVSPYSLGAQETGRLTGRVIESLSGQGLGDVGVQVVGTTLGGMTDGNGRYSIANVPAGTVTIQVRRIGYAPKTVTGIMLAAGAVLEQDIALEAATVQLQSLVVTAAAERGTVNEALEQQREALGIVNWVTAEQIARSPDGDAAGAVQRVSGVTVQDGKHVFVRGLGERYTTASLNGVRIPSPDPERKVVPLDMFPTSLLRAVKTSKTFTPDQPGDFAGASVDIQTRDFPSERTVAYSSSLGYNAAATGREVIAAPSAGTSEYFAFASGDRELPGIVRSAGNFNDPRPTQDELNRMIGSFRNSWTPRQQQGTPNTSLGASIGGNDPILGQQVGYVGSLTYSINQEVRRDRYQAQPDPGNQEVAGNEFRGSVGRTSVLLGGLFNASTFLGAGHLISTSNMVNRTSDSEAHEDTGYDENYTRDLLLRRSALTYVERTVRSNRIAGEHTLGGRHRVDWSATSSGVTRREPDRSDIVYASDIDVATGNRLPYAIFSNVDGGVRRTFADLDESSLNFDGNYRIAIGKRESSIKLGGLYRATHRDADVHQYSIRSLRPLSNELGSAPAEKIFDGRYTSGGDSMFVVAPINQGSSYEATARLGAVFLMTDYGLTRRVRIVGGARVEHSDVVVTSYDAEGTPDVTNPEFVDVLPAVAVNVLLSERQNLRFSVSQTLARPELRELSPVRDPGVFRGVASVGHPDLRRTLIQNADVRWEWYPNPGEILSIAAFAKRFVDPIEEVEIPTSGTSTYTWDNAPGAENYGIELEVRKTLGGFASALAPFTVFTNATLMHSEIRLDTLNNVLTNDTRAMVGQAPYVVNAGLTWAAGDGYSATALYNVTGERIRRAGSSPYRDTYESERHVLDVSLRMPLTSQLAARFDARNLLDAPHALVQGPVLRERYTTGRVFSVGLSWRH